MHYYKCDASSVFGHFCSMWMFFLVCWVQAPAPPTSLFQVNSDLYMLIWRDPLFAPLCKQLPPLEEKMSVCPALHHTFIIHREHHKQTSFSHPSAWSWSYLAGASTSSSSCRKTNMLLLSAGCRCTDPPRNNNLETVTNTNHTGQKTSAALASTGSTQVIALTWQALERVFKPVEATAMLAPCNMWLSVLLAGILLIHTQNLFVCFLSYLITLYSVQACTYCNN